MGGQTVNNFHNLTINLDASPDLSLTVDDGWQSVEPGSMLTYTIHYENTGNQGTTGAMLTANLPVNATFDPANSSEGWQQIGTGDQYRLLIGNLNASSVGDATIAVTVAGTVPDELEELSSTFSIADDALNGVDTTPANNETTISTIVIAAPDLSLLKSDGGLTSILPGAVINYTLTYANNGNQDAAGVEIIETLPANTTYDTSNNASGWQQVGSSNQFSHSIGNLLAGESGNIKFAVLVTNVPPQGMTSVSNTAEISDDGANGADPVTTNNSVTEETSLSPLPDLVLIKTGNVLVHSGTVIRYTLSYSNLGNANASGVVINETVPTNTTFNPSESSAGWEQ